MSSRCRGTVVVLDRARERLVREGSAGSRDEATTPSTSGPSPSGVREDDYVTRTSSLGTVITLWTTRFLLARMAWPRHLSDRDGTSLTQFPLAVYAEYAAHRACGRGDQCSPSTERLPTAWPSTHALAVPRSSGGTNAPIPGLLTAPMPTAPCVARLWRVESVLHRRAMHFHVGCHLVRRVPAEKPVSGRRIHRRLPGHVFHHLFIVSGV